jgi:hypothetical protein
LGGAYEIELSNSAIMLDGYLKNEPYTERYNIFAAFKGVKERKKFSENTINLIRKEILKRYEEWKPEIKREFREIAAKQAKEETDKKSSPKVIGWIVGIGSIYPWYYFCGLILRNIYSHKIINFLDVCVSWILVLAFPVAAGIFISRYVRNIKRNNLEVELIASMEKKEKEVLDAI